MKKPYHLSLDSRRRLILLRNAVIKILDDDRKYGFPNRDLSGLIGPSLFSVLSLLWCKPLRGVSRPFRPANTLDRVPFVCVRVDVYDYMESSIIRLSDENKRLRVQLGLNSSDELSF